MSRGHYPASGAGPTTLDRFPCAPVPPAWALSLLLLLAVAFGLSGVPAGAGGDTEEQPASRLLVVSVPTLLWHDIDPEATPNLHAFLEDAAVAGLATRVSDRSTEAGEAYATIGAANRAIAPGDLAALALAPDEPYGLGTAADEYLRYTGRPLDGAAGLLTIGGPAGRQRRRLLRRRGRPGGHAAGRGGLRGVRGGQRRPAPPDRRPAAGEHGRAAEPRPAPRGGRRADGR